MEPLEKTPLNKMHHEFKAKMMDLAEADIIEKLEKFLKRSPFAKGGSLCA